MNLVVTRGESCVDRCDVFQLSWQEKLGKARCQHLNRALVNKFRRCIYQGHKPLAACWLAALSIPH